MSYVVFPSEQRPVVDAHPRGSKCHMEGPKGRYVCTREDGHYGTHEAGIPNGSTSVLVATWDET